MLTSVEKRMKQHNALAKLPKGVALCFPLMLRTCDDWKKIYMYIVPPQRELVSVLAKAPAVLPVGAAATVAVLSVPPGP